MNDLRWDMLYVWWIAPYLLVMAALFAAVVRSLRTPGNDIGELTDEELGFVVGGPRRALQVAVGRLATAGAARSTTDPTMPIAVVAGYASTRLEFAATAALDKGMSFDELFADDSVQAVLHDMGDALITRHVLHRPSDGRVTSILSRWLPGMWVTGWAGIAVAGGNHGPVAILCALQFAVAAVGFFVIQRRYCAIPARTNGVIRARRRSMADSAVTTHLALDGPGVLGAIDARLVAQLVQSEREAALSNPIL